MASPFIISPNGSGETLGFRSSTFSLDVLDGVIDIHAGDVVYVFVGVSDTVDCTGITGSGLSFTKRGGGQALYGGLPVTMSGWSAVATAPLTGLHLSGTLSSTVENLGLVWCVVRGAVAAAPFDPHPGLPAVVNSTHVVSTPVTFSTTNSDDLLLFAPFMYDGKFYYPPFPVAPSAWTILTSFTNSGGWTAISGELCSQTVSAPQVNATADLATPLVNSTVFYVDALTANVTPNPPGLPTGEACGTATTTSITATWTQGSGGTPISYTLQWRPVGGGAFTQITGITGTSQVISGLSPSMSYEWQVEAINADGNSGFTAGAVCSTLAVAPSVSPPKSLNRWRGQVGINWNGLALVGDAFTGVIGLSDFDNFTEYGNVMRLLVTSPPLHSERHRIFIPRLEVDMQVGDGLASGANLAPVMMLDYSKDGGMTFVGLQKWRSMGRVGQYQTRLRWLNMGQARSWVFRLTCTDPVRRQIIGVFVDSYEGLG